MSIDYKKELETTARNMIFVHDPDSLIKLIVRMIINKAKITHASFFLFSKERQAYQLTVSKGSLTGKIPLGLISVDKDDVLIRFFKDHQSNFIFGREALLYSEAKRLLKSGKIREKSLQQLSQVLYQMELLEASACIPSYFRNELLGFMLLGKKENGKEFLDEELDFFVALNSNVAMAIRNARLFNDLEQELERKHQLFARTTVALAAAIEAKDHYTHGHTTRVTNISLKLARRIKQKSKYQLDEKFFENLHIGSLLHDIGKIGIPEHILNKRGELTIGERNRIKDHPLIGENILKPIKELEGAISGVKFHHERFDGKGYPQGLRGEEIPLEASIIAVADSFDAMSTDRPYRKAMDKDHAVSEIKRLAGEQFCPKVSEVFLELCREGKI